MRIPAAAFFIGVSFAAAQTHDSAKTVRLEGHVLNLTGEPLRKVTLRLMNDALFAGNVAAMTDDKGRFAFEDVPPVRYTMTAERTGFLTQKYGATSYHSPGTPLTLKPGQDLKDLLILMTPQGVITGKVTNQDGEPMVSLLVTISRFGYVHGKRQLQLVARGPTDDRGSYRVANLAPGRYYVDVLNLPMGRSGQEVDVSTYYPSEVDASKARPVDVAPGAEMRGIDIKLRRERAYSVRGTVAGQVYNLLLMMMSKEGTGAVASARPPDGAFEFGGLPSGTYIIRTNAAAPVPFGAAEVTIANADVDGVRITPTPSVPVSGTVKLEGGNLKARLLIALSEADSSDARQLSQQTQVKEDGTFALRGMAPSKYWVDIRGKPPGTYIKSIRRGKQDATHAPLDLTEGDGALDIVHSSNVSDVVGLVKNGKGEPAAGVMVTIWPKKPDLRNETGGLESATTDQNGNFQLADLGPGEYYAAAWEEVEDGILYDAEFRARFLSQAKEVTLGEGAQASTDLELIPRDRIAAEVAKLP
jgi:protocatechuate 3,4-dioxygenase beta subunit